MSDIPVFTPASTRAELRPLLRLSIPLMVSLGAALLIGVVDAVMIAPLGTVPLAASSIATAVMIIMISALWGLITVISVEISQAEGADDSTRAARALRTGLWVCLIGGSAGALLMIGIYPLLGPMGQPPEVLAILLPYWISVALWIIPFTLFFGLKAVLDAVDWPWTGVVLSYIGVAVNVPFNYLFIHVLEFGILGAGLASILSQCVTLVGAVWVIARAPGLEKYRARVGVVWADVARLGREGLPLCLGYAGEGGAYAMVGLMIGWLGAEALAANQIVNAVGGLAYVIPLGMAGAVSIRVGQAVGRTQITRLRPILKASFLMVVGWQAMAAAVFILGARHFAEALSDDSAVIEIAVALFVMIALLQIADGIQATALGALRGMSDLNVPTLITLAAYWPLALPMGYLLGFVLDFGAVGIWLGYMIGLAVAAVLLPIRFWRMTRA